MDECALEELLLFAIDSAVLSILNSIKPPTNSMMPIAATTSTLWANKSIWPTLIKQVCLTGFLCLEPLPKLLETYPFLLAPYTPTFLWCGYSITSKVP